MGVDVFYAEFHADFRSGLHFDLGGRTPEHKSFFQFHFQWNGANFLGRIVKTGKLSYSSMERFCVFFWSYHSFT